MQTAELSQALERFFAGWLDRICARIDKGEDLFYVLFAGGDDLFVVGPWTHMPELAQAIRDDFAATPAGTRHPPLGRHRGGGREGAALRRGRRVARRAAGREEAGPGHAQEKNAITFLGSDPCIGSSSQQVVRS